MGGPSRNRSTPTRIKKVTTDLLIKHGYRGASMSKIAHRVGSTTTNLYYHFKTKDRLVAEVIADYVAAALANQKAIWTDPGKPLREKIIAIAEFNRLQYSRYNRTGNGCNAWSLIGRMRLENDILNDDARQSLARFSEDLHAYISLAVRQALENDEIVTDMPLDDATRILTNIVDASSVFSQSAGSFTLMEEYYEAFSRFFFNSYGSADCSRTANIA